MKSLENILQPKDLELWDLYQKQEVQGDKKEATKALSLLINDIQLYDEDQLDLIVLTLCKQRENTGLKIRHNLFEQVIYPNLIKNALNNKPDYYRILATFEQFFHSSNKLSSDIIEKLKLKEHYVNPIGLLEIELKNNKNAKAATLLLNKLGWHLDYALHELPIGLMYEPTLIKKICSQIEELTFEYKIKQEIWKNRLNYVCAVLEEWEAFMPKQDNCDFLEHLKILNTPNANLILEWNNALYD